MDMIGSEIVTLRGGADAYPMGFIFAPCSDDQTNDGSIPYGTTISSATVTVYSVTGVDITSSVCLSAPSVVGGLRVNTAFTHPAGVPDGICKVIVALTLSDASVLPKRWDGLRIE